jgi:hypothetical protein
MIAHIIPIIQYTKIFKPGYSSGISITANVHATRKETRTNVKCNLIGIPLIFATSKDNTHHKSHAGHLGIQARIEIA